MVDTKVLLRLETWLSDHPSFQGKKKNDIDFGYQTTAFSDLDADSDSPFSFRLLDSDPRFQIQIQIQIQILIPDSDSDSRFRFQIPESERIRIQIPDSRFQIPTLHSAAMRGQSGGLFGMRHISIFK
jgi:hypothetical protein